MVALFVGKELILAGFSTLFFFPTDAGELDGPRYGARSRTVGAYRASSDAEFTACSSKREAVSYPPNGEPVCRSFRILIQHVGKKGVGANLNVELRPLGFPAEFPQNSAGERSRISKRNKTR